VPPEEGGLGVHVTPTVDGNVLICPSAEYVHAPDEAGTTADTLEQLVEEARELCPGLRPRDVIASFAGVRARLGRGAYGTSDFVIEESAKAPGLVNLLGIESPGLTAAPAIAERAAALVFAHFPEAAPRADYGRDVRAPARFAELDDAARDHLAADDPDARTIVCRCEQVTRAEVLRALDDPLGVRSLAGVRARCRAGAGRCQGGFCGPRIVGILRERYGLEPTEITQKGPGSEILTGVTKAWCEPGPADGATAPAPGGADD
jgi:glycerol-3-phosphate dehydrogenase